MKFALVATLGLGLASAAPSALPQGKQEASLAKRQGPLGLAVIGGVASAVASTVLKKFTGGSKRGTQVWVSPFPSALSPLPHIPYLHSCV